MILKPVSTRQICSHEHKNPTPDSSSSKQTSSLTNHVAVFSCSLQEHDGEEETTKDENNEKKETMDNEMAERLDILMTMMLEYIKKICYTEGISLPVFPLKRIVYCKTKTTNTVKFTKCWLVTQPRYFIILEEYNLDAASELFDKLLEVFCEFIEDQPTL